MEATVNFFLSPQDQEASLQIRRATSSQWDADNPVLLEGELGVDTTTGFIKVGNGVDGWSSLLPQAQLTNEINSTSTTVGASALAVKTAYDHAASAIRPSIIDAKGDLIVGSAADTAVNVPIGADNSVLVANSLAASGVSWSPSISLAGAATFNGASVFNNSATFNGTLNAQELSETVVPVTLSSNTASLDWSSGNVYYISVAPTGNMTFNLTNVPVEQNTIKTINVIVTQGSTGYIPTSININSSSQTIRWSGGLAANPTSSSGKIDIFIISLHRTASAWIVYASAANNF
jgi:hypothetical protein